MKTGVQVIHLIMFMWWAAWLVTVTDPAQYVDIRSGTYSRIDYSTGSLLPFVGRPFGMNNWALQTNNYAGANYPYKAWWFHPEDRAAYGIRCTHQASPWIYDYGELLFTPSVGSLRRMWPDKASGYNRSSATFSPDEINVTLNAYCTGREDRGGCLTAAVTATERAAIIKVRFPPYRAASGYNQTRHIRLLIGRDGAADTDSASVDQAARTLTGFTRANSGGVPQEETAMRDEEVHAAGAHSVSCEAPASSGAAVRAGVSGGASGGMVFSYSLRLWGHDLRTVHLDRGAEPVGACAAACCGSAECAAFTVERRRGAIAPYLCHLKRRAVHVPCARCDEGLRLASGWRAGHTVVRSTPKFAQ